MGFKYIPTKLELQKIEDWVNDEDITSLQELLDKENGQLHLSFKAIEISLYHGKNDVFWELCKSHIDDLDKNQIFVLLSNPIINKKNDIVQYLWGKAEYNKEEYNKACRYAIKVKNLNALEYFFAHGADINLTNLTSLTNSSNKATQGSSYASYACTHYAPEALPLILSTPENKKLFFTLENLQFYLDPTTLDKWIELFPEATLKVFNMLKEHDNQLFNNYTSYLLNKNNYKVITTRSSLEGVYNPVGYEAFLEKVVLSSLTKETSKESGRNLRKI